MPLACTLLMLGLGCTQPQPRAAPTTRGALDGPRKLAVLVGIAAYDRATAHLERGQRWRALRGPPGGVEAMHEVLRAQGFAEEDILVLDDQRATGEAIERAFTEHLGRARPGDIALFYYTGHGQQIPDDNADEADGYDESLVPWDSLGTAVYDRHLRDDRLQQLIDGLDTEEVILIIDACNAGSITRGAGRVLGAPPAAPPAVERGPHTDSGSGLLVAGGSGYVLLSASEAAEPAVELDPGRVPGMPVPMGALTWLLTQELSRPLAAELTWRELTWRLRSQLPRLGLSQRPQIEGDIEKQLFSGSWQSRPRHHRARILDDGRNLRIEAGSLHGLDVGDVLAVYKTGPDAPAEPVATATIRRAELAVSDAVLDKDQRLLDAQADRGLEVRPLTDHIALYAPRLELSGAPPELREPLERMARARGLEVVSGPSDAGGSDVLIRVKGGQVSLERADGSTVPIPTGCGEEMRSSIQLDSEVLGALEQALILDRLRGRILSLESATEGLDLSLEVTRVEATDRGAITRVYGPLPADGDGAMAHPGQRLALSVHSREDFDVFATLLELRTDGGVQTLFPYDGLDIDSGRVPAGGALELGVVELDPARGQLIWKLIGTENYVDFQSLEQRVRCRRQASRGAPRDSSPALTALLSEALEGDTPATRGYWDVGAWGTAVYFLRIDD